MTATISLLAGTAVSGYSGDGGPASLAETCFPSDITTDQTGADGTQGSYVYFADSCNNRIRMVDMNTGIITTLAGTGVADFSGDGGPAIRATLNGPSSVAMRDDSLLYIADTYNNRIRRIYMAMRLIETVAGSGGYGYSGRGGLATSALLNNPLGVAWDYTTSKLYIADTNNHRIRVVDDVYTLLINTVAGTGVAGYSGDSLPADAATLAYPAKLTFDSFGNMYIADSGNHRIRKVAKNTGVINTFAGTGVAGYSGDDGKAVGALLFKPSDVAVDLIGNVFIADALNNCIRKVNTTSGIITTVAGTGTVGYEGDGGPARSALLSQPLGVHIDKAGTIYVADTSNSRVRTITATGAPANGDPLTGDEPPKKRKGENRIIMLYESVLCGED